MVDTSENYLLPVTQKSAQIFWEVRNCYCKLLREAGMAGNEIPICLQLVHASLVLDEV